MNKQKIFVIAVCMLGLCSVFMMFSVKNTAASALITDNVAGTVTKYSEQMRIDWSTGGIFLNDKIKDVYTTSSKINSNTYNQKYQYLTEHTGPTARTVTVTYTSGVSRTTSVSASAEYSIFKTEASHTITASSAVTVSNSFTFPGDKKRHTLYVTRRYIDKTGTISRTSYISRVTSYTYIWGVYAWNIQYGSYVRYPSRDYSAKSCCNTIEQQFGTYMN